MHIPVVRQSARRIAAAAAAACVAVLAAGCGTASSGASAAHGSSASAAAPASSSPATARPSPVPSSSASVAATTTACSTSDLSVKVAASYAGGDQALFGTIGGTYVPIDFVNDFSRASCTLYGYPGVSFVADPVGSQIGSQIGPAAGRYSPPASAVVTLAPGGAAHAFLLISNATPAGCQIVTAHWLRVYPPGRYSPAYIKFSAHVCSGKISRGNLLITALQGGLARHGQAPPAG